jgi:hypothetical protein
MATKGFTDGDADVAGREHTQALESRRPAASGSSRTRK